MSTTTTITTKPAYIAEAFTFPHCGKVNLWKGAAMVWPREVDLKARSKRYLRNPSPC